MTRVVAGAQGGQRLDVPPGDVARPTSDRVKEALFSSLGDIAGAVVLDLYAGSGGLGIEALSRGAHRAVFIDRDRRSVATIRANLARLQLGDRARVVATAARRFCETPTGGPFDLIFLDPPYVIDGGSVEGDLRLLVAGEAVGPGATIVIERDRRRPETPPDFLHHQRDRTYGDTVLRYLTYEPIIREDAS